MAVYRKHISGDTLIILDKRIPAECEQAKQILYTGLNPPSWVTLLGDFMLLPNNELIAVAYDWDSRSNRYDRSFKKSMLVESAFSDDDYPLIAIVVDTKRILKDLIHGFTE